MSLLPSQIESLLRIGANVDLSKSEMKYLSTQLEQFARIASSREAQLIISAKGLLSTQLEQLARIGRNHITIVV
ncbi:hypothetical protein F3J02_03585 [Acinetobacter sp. Tr-809]|uniref:hypothetical protein n=1 Tax=Acinetobacter sp. Tr-809 TaxID=2608324 RepID=UPI0014228AC2|nr:hypothetical protein [Acinetobacter sp. Tr-809]NIE95572.1 hypothetical protein [Acinetobacter sp. Tr-809]